MQQEIAISIALGAISYIVSQGQLRERFLALSGLAPEDIRTNIQEIDFLSSTLEFLISHEPDLLACAEHMEEKPENLISAWRALGGGAGQEW